MLSEAKRVGEDRMRRNLINIQRRGLINKERDGNYGKVNSDIKSNEEWR